MDGSGYIKDDIYQYDPIGAVFNERPEVLNRQGRAYHGAVVVDAPCTTA